MIMTSLSLYSTREEWLAARGIGASDVAAILGLSPYARPFDLYARIVLGCSQPDTPDLARGRRRERAILTLYEDAEEVEVVTPRSVGAAAWQTVHPEHPWATCSPDGLVLREGTGIEYCGEWARVDPAWGIEAKTSRLPREWGEPGDVRPGDPIPVPEGYYLQCQWSAWMLGLPRWDLIADILGEERIYRIHADPDLQRRLVERVSAWRERHLVGREPPAVDGSDGADRWLRVTYPTGEGLRAASSEEVLLAQSYHRLGEEIRELEDRRRLLSQQLQAAIGEGAGLDLPGGRCSLVRAKGRTTLDTRRLQVEEPENYTRFIRAGFIRVGEPSHSIRITLTPTES
jgi:predicted phage-related endonuclease